MPCFRYTTVQALRDAGLPEAPAVPSGLTDAQVLQKIDEAGDTINRVTSSWFVPVYEDHIVDGRGHRYLHHMDFVPILKLIKLQVKFDRDNTPQTIDPNLYEVHDMRSVKLRKSNRTQVNGSFGFSGGVQRAIQASFFPSNDFSEGHANYVMDGYFGDMPMRRDGTATLKEVETTLATDATVGGTTFDLADVTGLSIGDVLLINREFTAIITAIASPTITVDALKDGALTGAEVLCVGSVYSEIAKAAKLLVIGDRYPLASSKAARSKFRSRIIFEKTDNYAYKLSGSGLDPDYNSTGNAEVDGILNGYMAPPYLGMV